MVMQYGLMLAGRAAMAGGSAVPLIGQAVSRGNVLKFLGVSGAIEALDQVLEMFGIDVIPDFSNPSAGAEAIIAAARSSEDFLIPRRPGWVPDDWELPGYFATYDFSRGRGFWHYRHITQNMLDGAVKAALTPATVVSTKSKTRKRTKKS